MMKKRKSPNDDVESGSEMDVDAEEKVDVMEDDDDNNNNESEEESEEEERREDSSFLDNFYGLSSSDPSERAQAANAILHHALIGPEANINDAAYALRRLLNGLCSGRAASRQGNASALASFLKVALAGSQLKEIQSMETDETAKNLESMLGYIRHRLLKATDPSSIQGKKKGSEERDYQFGRLFGILSVARSGILLPQGNASYDKSEILEVSRGFVSDLMDLYSQKKWMREPAAHAIGTMLNIFYSEEATAEIAINLVEELVVPELLEDSNITDWKAEQIALALTIQCHKSHHKKGLPSPLDKPILSAESMPSIAPALIETSSVALPRTHLVWDAMWLYLTEPEDGALQKKAGSRMGVRKMRDTPLLGSNSTRDVLEVLVRNVIVEGLLRVDSSEEGKKTTHEKRALAMCLVRNVFGSPFNSSITGATKIHLEAIDLENILTPLVIRRLFLDVICAAGGSAKKAHTLKPLALQILESIVESLAQDSSEVGAETRLRIAKIIVKCEPRFDVLTKTTTVSDLVGLNSGEVQISTIQSFFDFLEEQIASLSGKGSEEEGNMLNYLELLYQSSKRILRHEPGKEKEAEEEFQKFALSTVERVVGFFMAGAFFDCTTFSPDPKTPGSGKKKKKSKAKPVADKNPVIEAAERLNQICKKQQSSDPLPYGARFVLSERFYSLLAEYVTASIHVHEAESSSKDDIMLDALRLMCNGWKMIEAGGAKPLFPAIEKSDDEDGEPQSPQSLVFLLQGMASDYATNCQKNPDDAKLKSRKRCVTGCATLASVLFLHLLGCGKPDDIMDEDDVTTEDDDDSADILDSIEGIAELAPLLLGESEENEENPLAGFAEVCMGVFASRVSSGSPGRGASPRLLRDAVKFAWMGALCASATADNIPLDSNVVTVLLGGVGADRSEHEGEDQEEEEEEGDDSSDEDTDDDENSENELADFSKVSGILDAEGDEDKDQSDSDGGDDMPSERQGADDDKEVEINSEKLNSLLEDDSDADIDEGELEHHAGADAALAQLIKLKQDARKASQKAREKLEIERQLRCALLLEILLGKSESWASLLRCDLILGMALPLLTYRKQIETSLSRASGKPGGEVSSKKAMLDRLTSILKTKLFKLKFASMPASESVDKVEFCESQASSLMKLAESSSSKDQRSCCSAGLVCVVKAMADDHDAVSKVASVYGSAVEDWSTKRNCRVEVSLFDDLVNHCPSAAQATLIMPFASAAQSARSPFLKCEAYRVLSSLFNPKLNPKTSELDSIASASAGKATAEVADAIIAGLKDEDMLKPKRAREVLKACEKVIEFSIANSVKPPNADKLASAVAEVTGKVDNKGVKAAVEKLRGLFESLRKEDSMEVDAKNEEEAETEERESNDNPKGSSKKKKKKKKKGKK